MLKNVNKKINEVIENLRKNGFNVINVETTDEAKQEILKMIKEDEIIGVGGSLTIRELGVIEELMSRGNKVIHHWLPNTFIEEIKDARRKAVRISDVYLTGTNAITLGGELVNIDTYGNRVAAMIYGPPKVIIAAGYNKIVKDVDDGFKRIREEAAVKNAQRLNVEFPQGLCKVSTIIHQRPNDTDITIILINMELGY
ncbi:MAG: lactate utilization protein [Candidatus Goldbacteria bacterium]|nr:lactate utilization protein [Candidatus Goldiibacteriota bacterium]